MTDGHQHIGEGADAEWFDHPDPTGSTTTGERGLRFGCTCCGNCCSGPPGYVLFDGEEAEAIAGHLGLTLERFAQRYVKLTALGPSLRERRTRFGHDCIFLDRQSVPGKAVCGIYPVRPRQCRTWPFWPQNLRSSDHWAQAGAGCPGIDRGKLHAPQQIRILRDKTPG